MDELNPYAAPQSKVLTQTPDSAGIRREHLYIEAALRAAGIVHTVIGGSLLSTLAFVTYRIIMNTTGREWEFLSSSIFYFGLGSLVIGLGLYFLRYWAVALAAMSAAGMLTIGMLDMQGRIGTIMLGAAGLMLYLQTKTKTITRRSYREVIEQTPQIRCKLKVFGFILLFGILLLVAFLLALANH